LLLLLLDLLDLDLAADELLVLVLDYGNEVLELLRRGGLGDGTGAVDGLAGLSQLLGEVDKLAVKVGELLALVEKVDRA